MSFNIIEIKAKCANGQKIKEILFANGAHFKGMDHQVDTYFKVPKGRLKLREGNIENTLIYYNRPNQAGPKKSEVTYYKPPMDKALKSVLVEAMDILTIVDKKRGIYFIDNVKFHIDEVENLGDFVEIEAIDERGILGTQKIKEQCQYYLDLFGIQEQDLIEVSYSDLMMDLLESKAA